MAQDQVATWHLRAWKSMVSCYLRETKTQVLTEYFEYCRQAYVLQYSTNDSKGLSKSRKHAFKFSNKLPDSYKFIKQPCCFDPSWQYHCIGKVFAKAMSMKERRYLKFFIMLWACILHICIFCAWPIIQLMNLRGLCDFRMVWGSQGLFAKSTIAAHLKESFHDVFFSQPSMKSYTLFLFLWVTKKRNITGLQGKDTPLMSIMKIKTSTSGGWNHLLMIILNLDVSFKTSSLKTTSPFLC